jgi:D-alanyl-D-alanine carboxypeptidase/D-alanyl-D-alanine-endopeptidase (penicillin-binding protein 4)
MGFRKRTSALLAFLLLASMSAGVALSQPAGEHAAPTAPPAPTAPTAVQDLAAMPLGARLDAIVAQQAPLATARIGIFVQDLATGAVLYERDAQGGYAIASVTKVVTMAAALALLGPDFRFRTALLVEEIDGDGVIRGDLYLESRGNPMLATADLEELSRWLERAGVRRVRGELVVDTSYFDDQSSPPHFDEQPEEQAAFRAPVGAASLERNAFMVRVRAARSPGQRAAVWLEPETPYLRLGRAEVVTQETGRDDIRIASELDDKGRMVVHVAGQVRAGGSVLGFRRRVDNPVTYVGETLREILRRRGIRIRKPARAGVAPAGAQVLAFVESEPLCVLIHRLGKDSDNFVAETLLKTLAAEHREPGADARPATWQEGLAVVQRFLTDHVGLTPGTFRYGNGSGLFDASTFSPAQIGAVLATAHRNMRYGPDLMASLAIAGTDGTLRSRMLGSPARGRVRAKTGTLAAVSTLAGYLDAGPRPPVAFAIFINGIQPLWAARQAARDLQDGVVEALIEHLIAAPGQP